MINTHGTSQPKMFANMGGGGEGKYIDFLDNVTRVSRVNCLWEIRSYIAVTGQREREEKEKVSNGRCLAPTRVSYTKTSTSSRCHQEENQ